MKSLVAVLTVWIIAFCGWLVLHMLWSFFLGVASAVERRLYRILHDRSMERFMGKPYGTLAMRRRLDGRH